MSRFLYTEKMSQWLIQNSPGQPLVDTAEQFNEKFNLNQSLASIRAFFKNRKISSGAKANKKTFSAYTEEQYIWIKENYPNYPLKELTRLFNNHFSTTKTQGSIRAFTRNHKIKSGRTGRFEKGSVPWCKGKKGVLRPNKTSFKKGHKPHNIKHAGHERVGTDGYVWISVDEKNPYTGYERRYVQKHRRLWEKKNGPIPESMCLKCIDGNLENCSPENWELIERSVLPKLRKRKFSSVHPSLKMSVLAISKIEAKVDELKQK